MSAKSLSSTGASTTAPMLSRGSPGLAGTLLQPKSQLEGLARLASGRELTGKVADAVAFVKSRFLADAESVLRFRDIQKAIAVADPSNFRRTIREHEDFPAARRAWGWRSGGPGGTGPVCAGRPPILSLAYRL
jgi:hypothetical protein